MTTGKERYPSPREPSLMTGTTEVVRALSASEATLIRRWDRRERVWLWFAFSLLVLLLPFTIGVAFADVRRGDFLAVLLPPAIVFALFLCRDRIAESRRPRRIVTGMPVHLVTGEYLRTPQRKAHDTLGGVPVEFPRGSSRHHLPHGATVAAEVLLGPTTLVLSVLRCDPRAVTGSPDRLHPSPKSTARARLRLLRGRDSESPAGGDGPPAGGGA